MAAPTRIYALNLGTQTIGLAEFQTTAQGGVVLTSFSQGEILGDPGADATRVAQTKLQVQQLASEMGIRSAKVNYAIASHVIFTRPVRLPSVGDASQVEQIVGFEAAQNVPYPIDQVVWDWQLLDEGQGGQMEVILAAIKSDLLEEINDGVQSTGLRTSTVEIAPLALYNAFRYNYSDADGCTLLVDIGSRTTNLIFIEPGKIFPRRLNIGGSTITSAIAKDLGISFSEADARKAADGFVSLGGGYAEPEDPEVARISKIIRNQMTRLHQEIARSITFYRSEHGGAQPVRVLLAGNTASFPYMREFFQEKLQMEVEYFNPLQNVSVAPSLNVEHIGRIAHTLGELVGLALRSAVSCPMELNLRPPSVTRAEQQAKQRPYYIAAGVTLLATLAGWWLYFDKSATLTQRKADELTGRAESLKPIDNKIKQLRDELKREQDGLEPLLKAVHERNYWTSVINDLNSRLPADYIWITALELPTRDELGKIQADAESAAPPRRQGGKKEESEGPAITMTIRGLYLSRDAGNAKSTAIVDEYLANLAESPYVKVPDPSKIGRAADDTQQWAFDFAVPLELKNPISLK